MTINIINLSRRPDRKLSLVAHLDKMNCTYHFWEAYDDRSVLPYVNISNSHKAIVRDAKNKKLKSVLIAEDDLRLSSKNSLGYFFESIPEQYDIYFGMIYTGIIQDRRISHGFSGLQFYLINESYYDRFLEAPANKHLDVWLGEKSYCSLFYVCDPFICYGDSGYSDNFKRQWTFDEKKLPRNLYRQ